MNSSKRVNEAHWWMAAEAAVAVYSLWVLWKQKSRPRVPPPQVLQSAGGATWIEPPPASGVDLPSPGRRAAGRRPLAEAPRAPAGARNAPPRAKQGYWPTLKSVAVDAAKAWVSHRAASRGAALALYTLFSLAPMLLLVVAIAGFFFGADQVTAALLEQMRMLMGTQAAEAVSTILEHSHQENDGFLAGLVSVALVLVGATTAFAELKDTLDELWEVPPNQSSGLWALLRQRFLSFGLVLVLALMLLISLAISTALAALSNVWGTLWSDGAFQTVTQAVSLLVSFAIVTALFAVIFKYLPSVKIAWKDVLVGALITAVLFTIGKALIALYVGQQSFSSAYGAAGSVVVLIGWVYYSAQIFFYGALFTHEYALKLGSMQDRPQAEGRAEAEAA